MNNLIEFFIRNSKFTIIVTFAALVFGLMGITGMRSESYPAVNFATATITTRYDGATAEDIETKITKPIEDEVRQISGLKKVTSTSQSGLSTIVVQVDMDNVPDVDAVLSDVQKAVDRATDLPPDLRQQPKYMEINSEEFPAIELAVIGSNENRKRDLVSDLLKEDLEDIRSVLGVRLTGFLKREFEIRVNSKLMDELHIGLDEVLNKIQNRNVNIPGGELKVENTQSLLRVEGKIKNAEELQNVLIRSNFSGRSIYLKDIADVRDSQEKAKVLARVDGEDATLLTVTKKAGTDTLKLVDQVESILNKYKNIYKDEFVVKVYNNEALKVKNRLNVLSSNAISGLVLVVFFLLLFLPGWIGIMASLSLPIAVSATFGFMNAFGMNLDAITILALVIALGMLVDNSVVISENVNRLKGEGLSATDAAVQSVKSLWLPISATAFTTIAAFLPMLVTKGIMGKFIQYIPIIVSISLLISLFESFFLLPLRLTIIKSKKTDNSEVAKKSDWFDKIIIKFEKLMEVVVRRRYFVAILFGVVLVFCFLLMFVFNKFILFPPDQTEVYTARFETPTGSTIEYTNDQAEKISKSIKEVLGDKVNYIVARGGISQIGPNDPLSKDGNNVGMAIIYVTEDTKYNIKYTEILKDLRTIKAPYLKSLRFQEMVNGPPVGEPINATFRASKMSSLNTVINTISDKLKTHEGIFGLQTDDVYGDDEIYVEVEFDKVDRLGLDVNMIGNTIRTALSGKIISNVTLDNKKVELRVEFDRDSADSIEKLGQIKVMDRMGNLVPLSTLAKFKSKQGSPQIKRFDFKRSKTLLGQVDGEKMTSRKAAVLVKQYFTELQAEYPDVSLIFGGEEQNTAESMQSLGKALQIAIIGIFAIMVFLFKSYLKPFIILTTIPLGLVGTSIAFFLHGRPVSFLAMIGIIGLAGIIVNSGIVLISFIDEMRETGKYELNEILVKASGLRLRAVVVTSLTTVSGLIPTAYGIGGSDAMLVPMTMAMAWGLVSGTILTLIWIPAAYGILEDFNNFIAKKFK